MPHFPLLPDADEVTRTVARALSEDVGSGDVTANLIPAEIRATAKVICREQAVLCGCPWFNEVFRQLADDDVDVVWHIQEGQIVAPNQLLCTLQGSARLLLTGERCALNFLQTLSGTATRVKQYTELIRDTGTRLLDTRKTLPGLRSAQKYAVTCGGGENHRQGLYDAFLIKENHIMACGSITRAVTTARALDPRLPLEVEVENLEQLREALEAGVDRVLLDNFNLVTLREAVMLNQNRARLEASGGITPHNLRAVAETGVDYISMGALTKDVLAVDLSMRLL